MWTRRSSTRQCGMFCISDILVTDDLGDLAVSSMVFRPLVVGVWVSIDWSCS